MSITVKYFRVRLLILAALILTAAGLATGQGTAVACKQCVFPEGGICAGCMAADGDGYKTCTPNQTTCTCNVGGGTCKGDGPAPIGGGEN